MATRYTVHKSIGRQFSLSFTMKIAFLLTVMISSVFALCSASCHLELLDACGKEVKAFEAKAKANGVDFETAECGLIQVGEISKESCVLPKDRTQWSDRGLNTGPLLILKELNAQIVVQQRRQFFRYIILRHRRSAIYQKMPVLLHSRHIFLNTWPVLTLKVLLSK